MGGGPAQIFCPLFTNRILGQFGDAQIFGTLAFKKSGTSCPNWGEGVEVIWTIPKKQLHFFVKPSLREAVKKKCVFFRNISLIRRWGSVFRIFL